MSARRRMTPTERQRAYRARQRAGVKVAPVPVDDAVVAALLDLRWLAESRSEDAQAIGEAIGRMLADLAAAQKV